MEHLRRLYRSLFSTRLGRSILPAAGLLFLGAGLMAQTNQGTITGTVTDTQGAIIPNAEVLLTRTDTGFVLKQATNRSGLYVFSPIQIGEYSVRVTAPGFATVQQTGLNLSVNQTLTANITLQPGNVSQTRHGPGRRSPAHADRRSFHRPGHELASD